MRRKTAKELLAESFRELAEDRAIDKITVKEIAENCGYSQATFYRQFKDKYDLIAWSYSQGVEAIMDQVGVNDYSWKQTLIDGAISFGKEKSFLANLLKHTSGHESFVRYMTETNYKALKRQIEIGSGMKELDRLTEMYARLYVMGTVCLTCEWIMGESDLTPEELAEVYEKSLPLPLHPYLL